MTTSLLPYWLAASYVPGMGTCTIKKWLAHFPSILEVFQASPDELAAIGVPQQMAQAITRPDWHSVERDMAWALAPDHHIIAFDDEHYPLLLREIASPPLVLYGWGNRPLMQRLQLAMVGSRRPTSYGLVLARQLAIDLAEAGMVITSGMALGIDGASHRGALAAKSPTIGVAGTGLLHFYPPAHQALVHQMIDQQGLVVSEFSLPTPPRAHHFPRRNRIISGLSVGALVVEATLKSGSLITARCALEQGREVFAVPGPVDNPQSRGCHHLLKQGAKLVESVEDILEELPAYLAPGTSMVDLPKKEAIVHRPPYKLQAVYDHIGLKCTSMDEIIIRSRLTASEVSSILLELELQEWVETVPGGHRRIR